MGGGGAGLWALLACLFSAQALAAGEGARGQEQISFRTSALHDRAQRPAFTRTLSLTPWSEADFGAALGEPSWRVSAYSERDSLLVFHPREWTASSPDGPRRFSLEYMMNGPQARLTLRAGYRYGLPFDEVERVDDSVLLSAGGSVVVSAGTIAWLQLDFAGFRELAGARLLRLDAVPGIRLRPWKLPVDVGAGLLVALSPTADGMKLGLTRVLQLAATF